MYNNKKIFNYLTTYYLDKDFKCLNIGNHPSILKETLLNKLKTYNLIDVISEIGFVYRHLLKLSSKDELMFFAYDFQFKGFIYTFRIDLLLMITHFFIISGANKYGRKKLQPHLLTNLMYLSEIALMLQHNEFEISQETLLNHLCMYYKEQIVFQENFKENICHSYLIFKEHYAAKLEEITGLDYDTYFKASIILIILTSRILEPCFRKEKIERIIKEMPDNFCTADAVIKLLEFLSTNIRDYKSQQKLKANKNLIFLQYKPVIKEKLFNYDMYIVPLPHLLINKLFIDLYYTIQNSYDNILTFRNEFGLIFEKYIGSIIKENLEGFQILSEKDVQYKKNKSKADFVDWIVFDNDTAYLIDVKAAMLPLKSIYNTNMSDFIQTHIIKDYKQMLMHLKDIYQFEELKFLRDKKIIPIIIYKDVPLLNTYLFKDAIIHNLKQISSNIELINVVENNTIYLLNLAEFQLFWINRMNFQLSEIFEILDSDPKESIRTIIEKHPQFNYKVTEWSKIIDRIFNVSKYKAYCK